LPHRRWQGKLTAAAGPMIGRSVGNYQITQLLGAGGMGSVYLAQHIGLGRRAAVKVLHAEHAHNVQMVQRFFNEARAANATGHPGIVEVWDFGNLPSGEPYLMMEFLGGQTLAARMRQGPPLAVAQALDVADQAAAALGAAHAKGIIHRDLKPDNVFLIPDPQRAGRDLVKILDFGIAKLVAPPEAATRAVTRTGALLGTPLYMSPEQCRGTKELDQRSDVYSLGVLLYEMLAGVPPFVSDSWGELVHMHIGVAPPPLRSRNPDLPEALEQVVARTLAKDPEARFSSMAELQHALTGGAPRTLVLAEPVQRVPTLTVSEPPPAGRTTLADAASEIREPAPTRRRPQWMLPAVTGVVVIAAAVSALLIVIGEPADDEEEERPPDPVPAAVAPPPEPAPVPVPVAPARIRVGVVTRPAGARIIRQRDGAALALTPAELSWPTGDGVESLQLELAGHRTATVAVPLDRGSEVNVRLEPEPEPPASAQVAPAKQRRSGARAVARPVPRAPAPPPAPAGKRKEPLKI
jgi:serine/threonine protein kinase